MSTIARVLPILAAVLCIVALFPTTESSTYARLNLSSPDNQSLLVHVKAKSATEPYLSLDPAASSLEAYTAAATGVGVQRAVSSLREQDPAPVEFRLSGTLPRTYWLNVSRPIGGVLWWQTSATAAANQDYSYFRTELRVGDELVGVDANNLFPTLPAPFGNPAPWYPLYFSFPPETRTLPQGETLTLSILWYGGSTDFTVGTGGAHASVLEFAFFDADPLATGLYMKNHALTPLVEGQETGGQTAGESDSRSTQLFSASALVGLVGAGLGGVRRRRGGAAVVGLLVLATLGSACLGESDTKGREASASGTSTGSVNITGRPDPGLAEKGHGAAEGIVRDGDNFGVPLRDANVVVLGTSLAAVTDAKGHWMFGNISAGSYTLRVQAVGFNAVSSRITIENGVRTWVNVTLNRPSGPATDNTRAHSHDLWGGLTEKPFFEDENVRLAGGYILDPTSNGQWIVPSAVGGGRGEAVVPEKTVVLPGAIRIEVKLDWNQGPGAPTEMALNVRSAVRPETPYMARPAGSPFNIVFFPHEADSGHQKWTDWKFFVQTPYQGGFASPVWTGGEITLRARMFKGVVPYEPAHPDFWNGTDVIKLFDGKKFVPSATGFQGGPTEFRQGTHPVWSASVPPGVFVAPCTNEIRGTISWKGPPAPAENLGSQWRVGYRTANDPQISGAPFREATVVYAGNTGTFKIEVEDHETDQFYQTISRWAFSVDNDEITVGPVARYQFILPGEGEITFSASAHKDPDCTPE